MADQPLETQLEALLAESPSSVVEREKSTFDNMTAPFQTRLVLFGAGNLGRRALHALRSDNIEPLAFSDNAVALWGTEIDGLKVLSPADASRQFGRTAAFVVTIFNPGADFNSIQRQLLALSCEKVVPFLSLFWKYPSGWLPQMMLDFPNSILRQRDDVWKAYTLLGDELSRREYVAQLRCRLQQDFAGLEPQMGPEQEQYFPNDLFTLIAGEVFVDCGAFDGDTVRAIIRRRTDFGRIIALEPDPINFKRLQEFLSELPTSIRDKISPRMIGASAARRIARFDAGGTIASKVSDSGDVEIECEALDDLLEGCTPTFVKMDIEGAEVDALRGAEKIMRQNSAIWAVCVYHNPDDLWQVPLSIASKTDDYHFFLRKYVSPMWESVIYAVPSARLCGIG